MSRFYISRAPTHHSFDFNSWFLYELKQKFRVSETVCAIFDWKFWHWNVIILFKINIIKKPYK